MAKQKNIVKSFRRGRPAKYTVPVRTSIVLEGRDLMAMEEGVRMGISPYINQAFIDAVHLYIQKYKLRTPTDEEVLAVYKLLP